jgi:hypothetical protein
MTIFDPATTRTQIKSLLQTVTELQYVYDYHNPNVEGYPCAIFDIKEQTSEMLDDSNNLRTTTYVIYIMQEITVAGEQNAKDYLDVVVKNVINVLEKRSNDTLTNTVDWVIPLVGQRSHVQTPNGAAFMQELQLRVKIASTIL